MIRHRVKTAPSVEPVSLSEMRAQLGITQATDTSRDTIISARIKSAREMVEFYTRSYIINQTIVGYAEKFDGAMPLKGPVSSIVSVKYTDTSGTQQTIDPANYELDFVAGVLVPAHAYSWPYVRERPNSVQIEYIAGYGAASATVPESIRDAIKFIVGQWEVFQGTIEGGIRPLTIPNAAMQLLLPHVDYREFF
jgi:uncharacterized phiE125 gp8 family phage protein